MKLHVHGATLASTLAIVTAGTSFAQIQGLGEPYVPVSHDDSNKASELPVERSSEAPVQVEPGRRTLQAPPATKTGLEEIQRAIQGETRVEAMLTRPMVALEAREAVVRGRGFKASASAERFVYSPVVGKRGDASVSLSLRSVTRGRSELPLDGNVVLRDVDGRLEVDRGSVVEAYDYDLGGVEQLFRFDALEGSGDLVVTMDVDTELQMRADPDGLVFSNEYAQVNYSNAFVLDASGARAPIETTWDESTISLTVPADFLAGATFPVTIDPVLDSFAFGGGTLDDSEPDIAFDQDQNRYLVVFQDFVTSTDADLYYFAVSQTGEVVPGSFSALATGSATSHTKPAIAVNDAADQFLIVAAALPSGATNRQIEGVTVDVSGTGYVNGTLFVINDSVGDFDCFNADVAGNTFPSVNEFSYLVTWTRLFNSLDGDVHGRIVASDGSLTTGRISIDNSFDNDIQCSVSSSLGDSSLQGNYYNVVWIRDNTGNGRGSVWARRVYFDGSFSGPRPTTRFQVTSSIDCVDPVTTSASDFGLEITGERHFVVAYPRVFAAVGGGFQSSIYSAVTTFADVAGPEVSITAMEDIDVMQDQPECAIANSGSGFLLAYAERFGTNDNDYDQYMVSGSVMDAPGNGFVPTLGERHQRMAFSGATERGVAIASKYDGNERGAFFEDDACAVWTEGADPSSSRIEGITLDAFNNEPLTGDHSIGRQYCRAERNDSGRKGWIRAMGPDQSVGSTKRLVAIDLTIDAFGYLLAARNATFVANPAGSAGNLCVAGAGRYVNALASSGPEGVIVTTVDPSSVPQPNGFVSIAPGETWYFQLWSRDVQFGSPTSNFTNAVEVTFTN
ncbi:MAG: hypothetical protein AAF726_10755 [Planctomycetota bacterium]